MSRNLKGFTTENKKTMSEPFIMKSEGWFMLIFLTSCLQTCLTKKIHITSVFYLLLKPRPSPQSELFLVNLYSLLRVIGQNFVDVFVDVRQNIGCKMKLTTDVNFFFPSSQLTWKKNVLTNFSSKTGASPWKLIHHWVKNTNLGAT